MNKKDLTQIIREEISNILKESGNFAIPKEGGIIRIKGEHKINTYGGYISGGNYIVGKVIDDDGEPSLELFNKSRQRFTKPGERNLFPIEMFKQAMMSGSIKLVENN